MPAAIQRALISCADKTGLIEFAHKLVAMGVEIMSTGGTRQVLVDANIPALDVSEYTGYPELMDGRVKTLHPKIHAGILGRRDIDAPIMQAFDILDIDLVVVNLYPFAKVTQDENCSLETAIENIDIGGPTLLRGAAKNFEWTTVITEPEDYDTVLDYLSQAEGGIPREIRFKLAAKAFAHTARYDGLIAQYLGQYDTNFKKQEHSQYLNLHFELDRPLRYGENPQQPAALYAEKTSNQSILTNAEQHQGKALSFNNINDANTAMECCYQFTDPTCVIVKHANPCAAAKAKDIKTAYEKAFASDPTSSFGGIIAFNKTVDHHLIDTIFENQFVEVIIAPDFTHQALEKASKKPNVRILATGSAELSFAKLYPDMKRIRGGLLLQGWDEHNISPKSCTLATKTAPTNAQWDDLLFAWHICKYVKSNAIVLAKNGQTLGIGAGQMSRVFSVEIAELKAMQANLSLTGCVLASDAFFPFKDSIEKAKSIGINAVIQPGGSMRDNEVIQACQDLGVTMVLTHMRHFRH